MILYAARFGREAGILLPRQALQAYRSDWPMPIRLALSKLAGRKRKVRRDRLHVPAAYPTSDANVLR